MSRGLDWEKASRRDRLTYIPAPRSAPSTQRQLNFIVNLSHQKGKPPPRRLPLTKQGASDMIDRLMELPDVNRYSQVRVFQAPEVSNQEGDLAELREKLGLSPMTINALTQLFDQIDPIGTAFFWDGLCHDDLPEAEGDRLIYILKEFVDQFAS